ncbi:hypothetical protein STCU_11943 [Strigomonas culicis]|uniref:Uncharacterized protein n=1 Tax=Strigomonas culicis TaxID=28005 RepID=S9TGS3_9TRYP|nr:hypothetical protein STCU_11943 [Strigomonas culicis]|eukprot:EPY15538.1 hypothetical protein STCU_11943 [Strigomonas culicis]
MDAPTLAAAQQRLLQPLSVAPGAPRRPGRQRHGVGAEREPIRRCRIAAGRGVAGGGTAGALHHVRGEQPERAAHVVHLARRRCFEPQHRVRLRQRVQLGAGGGRVAAQHDGKDEAAAGALAEGGGQRRGRVHRQEVLQVVERNPLHRCQLRKQLSVPLRQVILEQHVIGPAHRVCALALHQVKQLATVLQQVQLGAERLRAARAGVATLQAHRRLRLDRFLHIEKVLEGQGGARGRTRTRLRHGGRHLEARPLAAPALPRPPLGRALGGEARHGAVAGLCRGGRVTVGFLPGGRAGKGGLVQQRVERHRLRGGWRIHQRTELTRERGGQWGG